MYIDSMYTLRGGNASTQFHGGEQKKKDKRNDDVVYATDWWSEN